MNAPLRSLPVLLALLALTLPVHAQEPTERFEELVEVNEVLLDVLVLDKKGTPVPGLGPDDFEVTVEGEPVEVTGASYYTTRYEEGATGAPKGDSGTEIVPASRWFVFFFHDVRRYSSPDNSLMRRQLEAGRSGRRWVEEEMGPSDWVAVASYDVKLKIHQDYTQDRAALTEAIEDAAAGRSPDRAREAGRPRMSAEERESPAILPRLPAGKDLRDATETIYEGLELLAEATGHVVGRKHLLLFSIGFGDIQPGFGARPDARYYPDLREALNANNVAVYPLDMTPHQTRGLQANFLNGLAADTGGEYLELFTDFIVPLREIASQATGYYLVGFRTEFPSGESGYREVDVDVDRKGLQVRAPEGFRFGHP